MSKPTLLIRMYSLEPDDLLKRSMYRLHEEGMCPEAHDLARKCRDNRGHIKSLDTVLRAVLEYMEVSDDDKS